MTGSVPPQRRVDPTPQSYSSTVSDPSVANLTRTLRRSPGVVVRPFADRRGAVVVGPTGVWFVEVEPGYATDRTSDWLYRLDRALSRPSVATVVRSETDVLALVDRVGSRLGDR